MSQLIQEAQANNSSIAAADHGARAARMVAPQKAALPDPTFTVQQFSVGSPRPFAGYTNSDFAYIGVGASQELPYPGKLRLRAEVAERDADTKAAEVEAVGADVADAVKLDYLQLAYLQQTLSVLTAEPECPRPDDSGRNGAVQGGPGDAAGRTAGPDRAHEPGARAHHAPSADGHDRRRI